MTMTDTVPTERTATAAELADLAARNERAEAGRTLPRTRHALCEQGAVMVPCPHCWARRGTPCVTGLGISGPVGYHVARFGRARRRGLLTEAELAALLDSLDAFTTETIVQDGAR
jgi:hypothetical protein